MYPIFLVFYYFFRSWCTHLFVSSPSTKTQYASCNLFQTTFRIPQSERGTFLLVLRKYSNFLRTLFFVKNDATKSYVSHDRGSAYIYDVAAKSYAQRKEYVDYFSDEKPSGGIFKSELYFCSSKGEALVIFFLFSLWLPFLFMYSIFKKDKAPVALMFKEVLETINLIRHIKQLNIKTLFFFSIYEKDSNVCTLILQRYGINVIKIPSEVPLSVWNSILIADRLCICSGYQYDELQKLDRSIFIKDTVFWGPENAVYNILKYRHPVETVKQTIGFYSTGAWVRKLENHIDQGFDMEKMEDEVKSVIRDFCVLNPEYSLIIFLHPRERWPKYLKQTIAKYTNDFAGVTFRFPAEGITSSNSFEYADLGVAFQTTIVYERLYYGFKTILMPIGSEKFPVDGSPMKNICANSKEDLFQKIKNNIGINNQHFFEKNGVNHFAKFYIIK